MSVYKLREFIKQLEKYIKEISADPTPDIDAMDAYGLGFLSDEAQQPGTSERLYELGDKLDDGNITTEEYIEQIKDIGKEYDV